MQCGSLGNSVIFLFKIKIKRRQKLCLWGGTIVLMGLLWSCQPSVGPPSVVWQIYRNPRYQFEFPYPRHWQVSVKPDNRDGQAFQDPQDPSVKIMGSAGDRLPEIWPDAVKKTEKLENFTTRQGITGKLQVDIEANTSRMKLTLISGRIRYSWQGESNSQRFASYYPLFYYSASEFRIPKPTGYSQE